jgi:hypothetical protein
MDGPKNTGKASRVTEQIGDLARLEKALAEYPEADEGEAKIAEYMRLADVESLADDGDVGEQKISWKPRRKKDE